MNAVMGKGRLFVLNKRARELLLSGRLHRVSNKCCYYNKELPMTRYGRASGRKVIIGVRQSESKTRNAKYTSCLRTNGNFTPIFDFSDTLMDAIYEAYDIEIPRIYEAVSRTGCGGCPYSRNCEKELHYLPALQKAKTIDYFRESYEVKGISHTLLKI
jgi:3'-phosphoadenosine 5'-phosphosulfate sulfotransferase (PAPS reductase)/FAD synthetase